MHNKKRKCRITDDMGNHKQGPDNCTSKKLPPLTKTLYTKSFGRHRLNDEILKQKFLFY